ncbi:MAG: cadmium-translocating P-type ATPase [Actinomycetota bacterium]|nr:cadmium-translocating P-type ATPase [Actinomycetota bacterium]
MSEACCGHDHDAADPPTVEPRRLRDVREIRLAVLAGTLLAAGLVLGWLGAGSAGRVAFLAALVAGGLTFVPQAAQGLLRRRLGVDTLMAVAAVGATILGEWGEAATLAFLFSIAEALESYALTRTRRGLRALLDLVPARATVRRGLHEQDVPPAELVLGDRLVVRPGERLATDGVVRAGRSAVDLSAVTGESVPVERGPGDEVFAAAVNGGGALEVEVTARSEDNSLARIVRIVEEAQERKGASQRLAERIARPLVPGVLVVAALVALAGSLLGSPDVWIERALVILVAAAPCAFAISVPVTVVAAIGAATRSGVLIKGGAALEALGAVRAVAFDKTGTLTRHAPAVTDVVTVDGIASQDALGLAAALEARSEHPLAEAILAAAPDHTPGESVEALPGQGIVGDLDGTRLRLGHPGFVAPGPLAGEVARLQDAGATVVVLERDAEPVAAIAVRDDLRAEAAEAVGLLARAGMREIAMVSGDNARTAQALARQAGITTVHAEQRPEGKVAVIEAMRARRPVAMVGDGINDAPALASANVGIAMGAMGTDVAIEAADVALMGDDLRHVGDTFSHARRAGRIMRQNLALSGGILLALVPLAATGALGLAAVVAVHELAEIVVIANGVRAGRRAAFVPRSAPAAPPVQTPARHDPVVAAGAR